MVFCSFFRLKRFNFFKFFFQIEKPQYIGKLKDITVNQEQDAYFEINIASYKQKPEIKWFKNDEEIIIENNDFFEVIVMEDTISLLIKNVKPVNAGYYHAQLTNYAGKTISNKAQFIINRKFFYHMYLV